MTLTLLPSAEVAAVAWAKVQADLAAIHGGRVATKLNGTLPAMRIQRVGGSPVDVWEDQPLLQWECWATDQASADLLARTLVAALPLFRGTYGGGQVYTHAIESGPFYSPDDPNLSTNARYILTTRLVTTPN